MTMDEKLTWLTEQGDYIQAPPNGFDMWKTKGNGLLFIYDDSKLDILFSRVKEDLLKRISTIESKK